MAKRTEAEGPPQAPPVHLSERSQALWREIVPRRARSPERLALLQAALEALDRADSARGAIEKDGLTITTETTGVRHMHPLLKVEADARRLFATLWRDLALHWCHEIDGRIDWKPPV